MAANRGTGPSTALAAREIAHWDAEADVVVVGLGAAGACAAIEAARAGARVRVLERAGGGGGTTAVSDGMMYFGGGTALQRACGFEDSVEQMFRYLLGLVRARARRGAHPRLLRAAAAAHYDWLVEIGVPFKAEFYPGRMLSPGEEGLTYSGNELVHPFRDLAVPAPRAHMPQKEGQAGALLMQKLIAEVERSGAAISTNVLCERLIVDEQRSRRRRARHRGRRRAQLPRAARRGAVRGRLREQPRDDPPVRARAAQGALPRRAPRATTAAASAWAWARAARRSA